MIHNKTEIKHHLFNFNYCNKVPARAVTQYVTGLTNSVVERQNDLALTSDLFKMRYPVWIKTVIMNCKRRGAGKVRCRCMITLVTIIGRNMPCKLKGHFFLLARNSSSIN